MKKSILSLLLLLSIIFTFVSCGELVPANNPNTVEHGTTGSATGESGGDETEPPDTEGGTTFTVTVMLGGEVYCPTVTDDASALKVRFTDGTQIHTVNVGTDGVAVAEGLDGDYTVTLLNVPEGYTYNPNIYKADNDNKNISVELLKLNKTYNNGSDMYQKIIEVKTGVFRTTLKRDGQVIYYRFTPTKAGRYAIESMVDITAGMYNPKAEIYTGSFASWYFKEILDDGGPSGAYTKNFRRIIEVDEAFLGSSYAFGVFVEGKDIVYPAQVDFSITYLGTYEYDGWVESNLVAPTFIPGSVDPVTGERSDNAFLEWREEYRAYLEENKTLFGSSNYYDAAMRIGNKRVFDQNYYKLNPDDGYYHVYNLEQYPDTNGYGPILYADITREGIFFQDDDRDTAFHVVEYNGNKALTLAEGTLNYKLFIEGYDSLVYAHSIYSGPYFCNGNCPCYKEYEDNKPGNNGGLCTIEDNCQQCLPECRHIPESMKYQKGYANIVNDDGRAPVTEELKTFLQLYSESQRLFSDGNGWVETYEPRYDAYEDSQWLFACGYYTD